MYYADSPISNINLFRVGYRMSIKVKLVGGHIREYAHNGSSYNATTCVFFNISRLNLLAFFFVLSRINQTIFISCSHIALTSDKCRT